MTLGGTFNLQHFTMLHVHTYLQQLFDSGFGLLSEGWVIDSEGWVPCDAEQGGICLLGAGFLWEEVVEDDTVAVLGIRVHMDGGDQGTLFTKQVQSIHCLQCCLCHTNGTRRRKREEEEEEEGRKREGGGRRKRRRRRRKGGEGGEGGGGGGGERKGRGGGREEEDEEEQEEEEENKQEKDDDFFSHAPTPHTHSSHHTPGMQFSPSHIVPGPSLPHPIVRDTIGTLHIIHKILNEVHLIHSEDDL